MNQRETYRPTLKSLKLGFEPRGWINEDVHTFLMLNDCQRAAEHCGRVARAAFQLAERFGGDPLAAEAGGWLHDVSAVWPADQRLAAAEALGVEILPEERQAPFILHQKLSVVLARELFGVRDAAVLSAVGCHTTLKDDPSLLDKVVFIADKLAWDEPFDAPWHPALRTALEHSLDDGCRVYLRALWGQREELAVLHPWMADACKKYGIIEQ